MDALDLLRDLSSRPRQAAAALRDQLDPVILNARPGGHDNSVAWLLWHTGREIDVQLAALTGDAEVWATGGYASRLGLGEIGDGMGYGHTPQQARRIVVEDPETLLGYIDAVLEAVEDHLEMITVEDLDDVVDAQWDPPVTRGTRLVSILDDAIAHLGQAAYALGMPLGR